MSSQRARIELPEKIAGIFSEPRGKLRYRGAYGGRGSGKSYGFALMALIWGYMEPLRILCTRELQDSIKESFHAELKAAVNNYDFLKTHYIVGSDFLRGKNGTEFLFKGLRHNIGSIKSTANIDICIVEEAEDVPEHSWQALEPTIRAPKSEIWVIWNPKREGSPVDERFVKNTPPRSNIVKVNFDDNPFFPIELEEQRQHAMRVMDRATYEHIWEGEYLRNSKAQIFADKYREAEFTPGEDWNGPYQGLDFGFSQDPTAAVRCWVHNRKLWIEYERGGVGVEIDETAALAKSIPEFERYVIRADSARPESISYLSRNGLPRIEAVEKGEGSVEDGIAHIRGYDEVIIHSRCKQTLREFALYSYKVDRLTGDVLPIVVDANNHYIDAVRYALRPLYGGQRKIRINQDALRRAMSR